MTALPTTCPYCSKPVDAGQSPCPHCYLRLPGVARSAPVRPAAAESRVPRLGRARDGAAARETGRSSTPKARTRAQAEAKPAGQCPACAHPITTKDEWCKWCHWPVNRKS